MWQVTIFRMLLVIITGIFVFWSLLHVFGYREERNIKKRSPVSKRDREGDKVKIMMIYFFVLLTVISLCFILIQYLIRGVV